jgi:hypothetical protein
MLYKIRPFLCFRKSENKKQIMKRAKQILAAAQGVKVDN